VPRSAPSELTELLGRYDPDVQAMALATLEGSGKAMRHVKMLTVADAARPGVLRSAISLDCSSRSSRD
jgi:hypothetical protein